MAHITLLCTCYILKFIVQLLKDALLNIWAICCWNSVWFCCRFATAVPGSGYCCVPGWGCLKTVAVPIRGCLITGCLPGGDCVMRYPSWHGVVLLLCGASWRFPHGPGTAGSGEDAILDFLFWGPFPGMLFLRYGGLAFWRGPSNSLSSSVTSSIMMGFSGSSAILVIFCADEETGVCSESLGMIPFFS